MRSACRCSVSKMTKALPVITALFALLSRAGAFVSPAGGIGTSSFSSNRASNAVQSRPGAASANRGVSYRARSSATAAIMAAEKKAVFGGGCFWCIEAVFKTLDGVSKVVSGYAGGTMENPTYRDVCSGRSGHAEVVLCEYDPDIVAFEELLEIFWKSHDPTQGNRQGLDMGTEYRSVILCEDEKQLDIAIASRDAKQAKINAEAVVGRVVGVITGKKEGENIVDITTTIDLLQVFWEAERVHQNYYAKNPLSPYCIMNVGTKLVKLRPDISRINRISREREQAS
ncbi:unnamed protein product [Pylaiella littoralis]